MANARKQSHNSLIGTIVAGLFVLLVIAAKEIIGNEISDTAIGFVARMFGVQDTFLVAVIKPYVLPTLVSGALLLLMYRIAYWHLEQTVFSDDPKQPVLSLPQMTSAEIAEYLIDQSVWGRSSHLRFNSRSVAGLFVGAEMERAGKARTVRFIGVRPYSGTTEPIDSAYWEYAHFDGDRIFDPRLRAVTKSYGISFNGPSNFELVSAPRIDVIREWPKASWLRKVLVGASTSWKKRLWFPLSSWIEHWFRLARKRRGTK